LDICQNKTGGDTILGMTMEAAHKRLKSWFCKTAALILSPYQETLISDLDVVWFKSPDVLFESPGFKETGSMFFRDKLTHSNKKNNQNEKVYQDVLEEFIVLEGGFNLTTELGKDQFSANGVSFFWKELANRTQTSNVYNNFQDSSLILMDLTTHKETLKVLTRLLPLFAVGYGDKEIYWLSATIAKEPFTFEPFLCSTYGDCGGFMTHYDPADVVEPSTAKALYINAEWYLTNIHTLGKETEEQLTLPVIVKTDMSTEHLYEGIDGQCTCHKSHLGCQGVPSYVNAFILRAQWERLTRDKPACMPMVKSLSKLTEINMALKGMIDDKVCDRFGCAYWPIYVNTSTVSYSGTFCLPLSYNPNGPETSFRERTETAQEPPPIPVLLENSLIKGSNTRDVYLIVNGTKHAIKNGAIFETHGWDFDDVKVVAQGSLDMYPKGKDIDTRMRHLRHT